MPNPRLSASLTLYETAGLTLTVLTSDLMPWNLPIQVGSYSVFRPNGTLRPTPKLQTGVRPIAKNALGTKAVPPASPPFPLSAGLLPSAGTLPLLENFHDGRMAAPPTAMWVP